MAPVLYSKATTVFLEITLKCYTGCPWCYKGKLVHSRGQHVPLAILKSRIDWLINNINPEEIGPIGGEPFTQPEFIQICNYILSKGKKIRITTSGKISKLDVEKKNLEYALKLYKKGLLNINLSFQPGQNEKAYLYLLGRIMKIYKERRESYKATDSYEKGSYDLVTVVSIDRSFLDPQKAKWIVDFLAENSGYKKLPDDSPHHQEFLEAIAKNYSETFLDSDDLSFSITPMKDNEAFRHRFLLAGLITVVVNPDGSHHVVMAQASFCDVVLSEICPDNVKLPSILIRTDGDLIFAQPHCIPMKNGLCNVDIHRDPSVILETVKTSLDQMKGVVFIANRLKAADNCNEDGTEKKCTKCPFDRMCDTCHSLVKTWS